MDLLSDQVSGSAAYQDVSRLASGQYCHPKGHSIRIRSFEQGGMHVEAEPSPASQKLHTPNGRVSSRIIFFEQGASYNEDRPEPFDQYDFPKGAISARANGLDANSARQFNESFGRNVRNAPAETKAWHSISDKTKALKEGSTRQLEESSAYN